MLEGNFGATHTSRVQRTHLYNSKVIVMLRFITFLKPYAAGGKFGHYKMMQKT